MIVFPSDVATLFDQGRIITRGLMRFEFGTGTYGFIKSIAPFTYNGLTYVPGGIIKVSDISADFGGSAQQFTITLTASPDDNLTPAILQTIEAEDYRDRPVIIMDAYFHPDTNEMLHVQPLKRGYCDNIEHIDTIDTGYTIEMSCETRSIDYTRTNGRKRTQVDQQRRAPGDDWYINSPMRGREEIFWGRLKP